MRDRTGSHRVRASFTRQFACASAALIVAGAAQSAHAQFFWDSGGGADQNWSTAANWSNTGFGDSEPTIFDFALLNNGGTIVVNQPGEVTSRFQMGRNNYAPPNGANPANLGLGGTVNILTGGELTDAGAFDLGVSTVGSSPQPPSTTNTLNVSGGTLVTGEFLRVAAGVGTAAVVNLTAGVIDISTQDTAGTDTLYAGDNGNGTFNMSGGLLKIRRQVTIAVGPTSLGNFNFSNGTIDARADFVTGNTAPNSGVTNGFFTHTGGTLTIIDRYAVGFNTGAKGLATQSGGSVVAAQLDVGRAGNGVVVLNGNSTFSVNAVTNIAREAANGVASTGTLTVSGSATLSTGGMIVGRQGNGILNLSGGSISVLGVDRNGGYIETTGDASQYHLLVGRDGGGDIATGNGIVNHTGGTMTVATDMFLGDFDDSNGVYNISGGTLAIAGNVHIGGALASNAPPDATRIDTQGQAVGAKGTLHVTGTAATITVGGNFLANPADRTRTGTPNAATLVFDVSNAAGTSLINVTGAADLDGAVLDVNLLGTTFVPSYLQTFTLMTAASFGATGTSTTQNTGTGIGFTAAPADAGDFTYSIINAAGGRKSLIATNQVVPGDTDNDKDVDFTDLLALARNYDIATGRTRAQGDFDRSGGTTFDDLLILARNYGFGGPALAVDTSGFSADFAADFALAQALVPEPTTLGLIGGALALTRRRRTVR